MVRWQEVGDGKLHRLGFGDGGDSQIILELAARGAEAGMGAAGLVLEHTLQNEAGIAVVRL
jgi:hypothetical protein